MNEQTPKYPLWKQCLEDMRSTGFTYQSTWPATFFEEKLKINRTEPEFEFAMLEIKSSIESEDGYYLQSSDNGNTWSIPSAAAHEDVAARFESKMKRYANRSVAIRSATLQNSSAELTDAERKKMEANMEKASVRLVLLARTKSITDFVRSNRPKLLE